jgi:hypothetical protein
MIFFFVLSDAYGHPHPASLTSELEERAPASNNAGNHIPRGQTFRGTTFGYLCKSVKKTALGAIRDISAKKESNKLALSIQYIGYKTHHFKGLSRTGQDRNG